MTTTPTQRQPLNELAIETTFLLAPPDTFNGHPVVSAFYLPPQYGQLDAHLVVFYEHPEGRPPWAPERLDPAAKVFGVGRIDWDDDAQCARNRTIASELRYADAIQMLARSMQASVGQS